MSAPWTIGSILDWTTDYFSRNKIDNPRLDAEILLSTVLKCPRLNLHLKKDETVPERELAKFKSYISERQKRTPVAYIIGSREFMGLPFKVTPHTLIPRPETELLVEETVACIGTAVDAVVADIGTGTGCIAVSVAVNSPGARVYACDISRDALEVAQENINAAGCAAKVFVRYGDLFTALAGDGMEGRVDVVVSNPPYIAEAEIAALPPEVSCEPRKALIGGKDGLEIYRRMAHEAKEYLRPGGHLLCELSAVRAAQTAQLFEECRYKVIGIKKDYAGLDRILVVQNKR